MLVFVHINKTAGRTVRYILRSSYGPRHCEVEPWHAEWGGPPFTTSDLKRLRRIYPKLASIAGHRLTGYTDLYEEGTVFRYFTFLRDPLKLCASRFQYHVQYRRKADLVFEEWIQQEWLRNAQTKQIGGTQHAVDAIRIIEGKDMFVGLTELFDESLVLLKGLRADDLDIRYTSVNVARTNTLAAELLSNHRSRQAIVEANQEDLALYDYVKSDLFPIFQRDYGRSFDDKVAEYRNRSRRKFNRRNLTVSRLKQYTLYKPVLRLHRRQRAGRVVDKLLGLT
jgi:hypothetical protein